MFFNCKFCRREQETEAFKTEQDFEQYLISGLCQSCQDEVEKSEEPF